MRLIITEEEKQNIRDLYGDKYYQFNRCMTRRYDIIDEIVTEVIYEVWDNETFIHKFTFLDEVASTVSSILEDMKEFECGGGDLRNPWIYMFIKENWQDKINGFYTRNKT